MPTYHSNARITGGTGPKAKVFVDACHSAVYDSTTQTIKVSGEIQNEKSEPWEGMSYTIQCDGLANYTGTLASRVGPIRDRKTIAYHFNSVKKV